MANELDWSCLLSVQSVALGSSKKRRQRHRRRRKELTKYAVFRNSEILAVPSPLHSFTILILFATVQPETTVAVSVVRGNVY